MKIRNLVKISTDTAQTIWRHLDDMNGMSAKRSDVLARIHSVVDQVADLGGAANLPGPSQQAYAWLKFLSNPAHFEAHVSALRLARAVFQERAPEPPISQFILEMTNLRAIYRFRQRGGRGVLKVSEALVYADRAVWEALFDSLFLGKSDARSALLNDYFRSEACQAVQKAMRVDAVSTDSPRANGQVHDLDASFERVNTRYFSGQMEKPRLHWNRRKTFVKFGHYRPDQDEIMFSLSLDAEDVSQELIDFVMYHELLHKQLGAEHKGGRRYSHTPAFRQAEQAFENFALVKQELEDLATRRRQESEQRNNTDKRRWIRTGRRKKRR